MNRSALLLLFCQWSLFVIGQRIGPCSPTAARNPLDVEKLRGVIVDQNLARVPKVKVELQILSGKNFADVESVETDSTGRFSFGT